MTDDLFLGVSIASLVAFMIMAVATVLVAKGTYTIIRRILDDHLSHAYIKAVARIYQYVVLAMGFYLGFWEILRLDLAALLASLGILGIGVALASQQILANAFAGLLISITNPFRLDEWVEVAGVPVTGVGRIKDINLINTVILDMDGRLLYVPNSVMVTNKVINYSRGGFVALKLPVWLGSLDQYERIRGIVLDVADKDPLILPHVSAEEDAKVKRVLEISRVRRYLGKREDMSQYNPQVIIRDIQRDKVLIDIKIWIRDISQRDSIVTNYLDELRMRFKQESIDFGQT